MSESACDSQGVQLQQCAVLDATLYILAMSFVSILELYTGLMKGPEAHLSTEDVWSDKLTVLWR